MSDLLGKSISLEYFMENQEKCLKYLDEHWNEVPLMNSIDTHNFQDMTLVRFYGMIQDMYTPEYFFESYEVVNTVTKQNEIRCGKYRDVPCLKKNEELNIESLSNVNQQRQIFYMISLPGLNNWVQNLIQKQISDKFLNNTGNTSQPSIYKRNIEDANCNSFSEKSDVNLEACNKKNKLENPERHNNVSPTKCLSPEFILNFPIADRPGKSCLLKVYSNYDSIKLNEMIEVVGFLSIDPVLSKIGLLEESDELESDMEVEAQNPPPSLIPRIHLVKMKPIIHNNPLVSEIAITSVEQMVEIRKNLHLVLTQLLLGDTIAANYLICHLISTVYLRKDMLSLGQCSLNISNIPTLKYPEYAKQLYDILESMVTKSYYFPLTLENMNTLEFTPKKDYNCNRVNSGLLQLSNNTHFIIDESKLQAGQLNQSGLSNLTALGNVIKTQKVKYDFKYYDMEFDSDIPVLIFSEGKSILPSDFHVPVMPDSNVENLNETFQAVKHYLQSEILDNVRRYLTVLQHTNCDISDDIQEIIQEDFVEMRQQNMSITADDLHQLLVLSRLLSLSYGEVSVQKKMWSLAQSMEKERRSRISANTRAS